MGGSSGRNVCLLVLNRVTGGVIALCRRQAGRMLLAVSRQIFLAVAITVVVTDMVVPNTVLPMSACLCRIARKIAVASKTIGCEPSATSVFCSVFLHLCFCVYY